jgi:TatD DNase family protein
MIDSHCHLADPTFAEDLEAVVRRAQEAGVTAALCVVELGDRAEALQAGRVRALWPAARFAVGLHPHEASAFAGRVEALAAELDRAWAATPGVCAIGEIGLDYHYDLSPRDVQREVFRAQVRLARKRGRPVIVHTREADEDTVSILEEEGRREVQGVFHCFSGTAALADAALDLGFLLSFSGIVTFPKAEGLRSVAASAPAGRLLVETDCPYLAPVPCRGKRNEPAWVVHTAGAVAAARGVDVQALEAATTRNFHSLFGPAAA